MGQQHGKGRRRLSADELLAEQVIDKGLWKEEISVKVINEARTQMDEFARQRYEERLKKWVPRHSCDKCANVIDVPVRYHCSECRNYDLCAACYDTTDHSHEGLLPGHCFARETLTSADVHDTLVFDPSLSGNIQAMMHFVMDSYEDRRCFGYRRKDGDPVWVKFRTAKQMTLDAARALHEFHRLLCGDAAATGSTKIPDLLTHSQVVRDMPEIQPVCLIGTNRATWFYADFAACLAGQPTVPFYHTMSAEIVTRVLEETGSWIVFVNHSCLDKLVSDVPLPRLKLVVLLDEAITEEQVRPVPGREELRVVSWNEFLFFGARCPNREFPRRTGDDLFTIRSPIQTRGLWIRWCKCLLRRSHTRRGAALCGSASLAAAARS
jgi:hypothetical protein